MSADGDSVSSGGGGIGPCSGVPRGGSARVLGKDGELVGNEGVSVGGSVGVKVGKDGELVGNEGVSVGGSVGV